MNRILLFLAISTSVMLGQAPAAKQVPEAGNGKSEQTSAWRTNAAAFEKEIRTYYFAERAKPDGEFPNIDPSFLQNGGEVPMTFKVMQVYSGPIEWEGTFKTVDQKPSLPGRPNKIDLVVPDLGVHIYPAVDAVEKWTRLVAGAKVKFRGTIEGIAGYAITRNGVVGFGPLISIKDAVPVP